MWAARPRRALADGTGDAVEGTATTPASVALAAAKAARERVVHNAPVPAADEVDEFNDEEDEEGDWDDEETLDRPGADGEEMPDAAPGTRAATPRNSRLLQRESVIFR